MEQKKRKKNGKYNERKEILEKCLITMFKALRQIQENNEATRNAREKGEKASFTEKYELKS